MPESITFGLVVCQWCHQSILVPARNGFRVLDEHMQQHFDALPVENLSH